MEPKRAIPAGVVKSIASCFPGLGFPKVMSREAVGAPALNMHWLTHAVPQKSSTQW